MIITENTTTQATLLSVIGSGLFTLLVAIVAPVINRTLGRSRKYQLRRVARRLAQSNQKIAELQAELRAEHRRNEDDQRLIDDLDTQLAADQDASVEV